jgi:threonine synthase
VQAEVKTTPYSYLSHLQCSGCSASFDADVLHGLCACGSPLLARYDLDAVQTATSPTDIRARRPDLWRYHELLPVRKAESVVTFGESMTPLIPLARVGESVGLRNLSMKDESALPTATFKARGAATGVSRARELGVHKIAMPSNGNAGAAWAAYAARAGIASYVVMPSGAPRVAQRECVAAGAELHLVRGFINDAGTVVAGLAARDGWFDASTLKEPYRVEGKKTIALEIVEQLSWRVPDVILCPAGGGVAIIGIYKGLLELQALGWISRRLPRLVAVQAQGCAPIVRAFELGQHSAENWTGAATIAFGINVPWALGASLVLDAVYATSGCAVSVNDREILAHQALLARLEGCFVCLEGAAAIAALPQLTRSGWLGAADEVVVVNTGAGLTGDDLGSQNKRRRAPPGGDQPLDPVWGE